MTATTSIDLAFLARLKAALDYDPETGIFRWNITKGRCQQGAVAGKICANGYRYIGFEGRQWLAHRLAWIHFNGSLPPIEIDHADRDTTHNAIRNLRSATRSLNNGNSGIWRTNSSGFRGVSWDRERGRWAAYIWRSNRKCHLGYFDQIEEAARAYNAAAERHFGAFACINAVAA